MRKLIIASVVLFAVRLWAAGRVGFGDSEALYASWAVHPQPAYLDHPGLVGLVARAIGEGGMPTPGVAHIVTAIIATLIPWLLYAIARTAGADATKATTAALVVAFVPEIAVGLFALTPDLLLAPLWLSAIGLAIVGLTRPAGRDLSRAAALLGAGLVAGIAASAKVTGLLLIASLAFAYVQTARSRLVRAVSGAAIEIEGEPARAARSLWPWAGLLAGLVVLVPVVYYEHRLGFPMLRHRFVDSQVGAGVTLLKLGALLGGQLAYVSPVALWLAILIAIDLVRQRNADVTSRVLFASFAVPLVPLVVLCSWSPVAEPHWLAPPLLALPIHAARRANDAVRFANATLVRAAALVGAILTAAAHAWVLVPGMTALLPSTVDPKTDISNELYGWPKGVDAVREEMRRASTAFDPDGHDVVVVGPHWTVCAQLHAALPGVRVGCATPIPDDFDRWVARDAWRGADTVLFVTDNRFPGDGADQLPAHVRVSQSRVRVMRGGRTARVFELYLYSRHQRAAR
jgi:hypothetical protein